jgi:hypothetical protein
LVWPAWSGDIFARFGGDILPEEPVDYVQVHVLEKWL